MKRRIKKIRGTRTCGGGSHKKRRGKGSKGGSGNAGAYEHHFVRSLKQGIRKGKRGRPYIAIRRDELVLNVGELEERLEELLKTGKAEARDDAFILDTTQLGISKILGKGEVTKKLIVKAKAISSIAKGKIEQAGGSVEVVS